MKKIAFYWQNNLYVMCSCIHHVLHMYEHKCMFRETLLFLFFSLGIRTDEKLRNWMLFYPSYVQYIIIMVHAILRNCRRARGGRAISGLFTLLFIT